MPSLRSGTRRASGWRRGARYLWTGQFRRFPPVRPCPGLFAGSANPGTCDDARRHRTRGLAISGSPASLAPQDDASLDRGAGARLDARLDQDGDSTAVRAGAVGEDGRIQAMARDAERRRFDDGEVAGSLLRNEEAQEKEVFHRHPPAGARGPRRGPFLRGHRAPAPVRDPVPAPAQDSRFTP